jgi:peptidoglycan/LPS O-acetylase OafA/YrhL
VVVETRLQAAAYAFILGVLACSADNGMIKQIWFHSFAFLALATAVTNTNGFATAVVVTSEVIAETGRWNKLTRWLNWQWLQFLGLISYSLYLTHSIVGPGVFYVGYRITKKNPATEALWLIVRIVACIVAADLFWWLIERPSHALSRRIRLEANRSPAGSDLDPKLRDDVTWARSCAVSSPEAET